MNKRIKITFYFLILFGSTIYGTDLNNQNVLQVFNFIYNQQYDKADSCLQTNKDVIGLLYFDILSIDLNYWKCVTTNTKQADKVFTEFLEKISPEQVVSESEKLMQMVVFIYSLRFHYKRHNLIRFNLTWIKMKLLLNETDAESLTMFKGAEELMSLYYSIFQYFELKYSPVYIFKGRHDTELYLGKIEQSCLSNQQIVNTLSNYFIGKIYLKIEKENLKAGSHFDVLIKRYPKNIVFKELKKECL